MIETIREDLKLIAELIEPECNVLDLGCGEGTFLHYLKNTKRINVTGIEINQDKIFKCLSKGLNVVNSNLDEGLALFDKSSFDYVILNETLQVLHHPIDLLTEMLRVGKTCIVGISNFGHWKTRIDLLFRGHMPVTEAFPFDWYNTPNIHLCTLKDFELACRKNNINVINKYFYSKPPLQLSLSDNSTKVKVQNNMFGFNLFASYGVYVIKSNSAIS
ncbi:MAG: methionine biosynthesis protein MetW [Planctomycetota bacterium]|nr:MAG: methionine biosynthesis protein MetW [Planctomycetota bacterium]